MNMLEALLAVAVVSVGLGIVVDVLEDAATVESAVMFREDMDALRESVAQSQAAHPKDPLMGWFELSDLDIPAGGRELMPHGRHRIERHVASRFGEDDLGRNPMSGDPYDVRWLDPDDDAVSGTNGPRPPAAFVTTTVIGPEDARLAAGSLLGRPVHVVPTIGPNDPEDTVYTVRLRVLESSKALLAENAKGVGSDIRYVTRDWDGDGTNEWGVEDIPITRPLRFAETLRFESVSGSVSKGAECEGNQLFVTSDGEIVTCLNHDEDDESLSSFTPRQWHGAGWHPDAKQEAVCSIDRSGTNCDCVDGASTSDPRLCATTASTADRATVAADIPGWAATEHVHVCPDGYDPVYLWPDTQADRNKATDGRAFANVVAGNSAITWQDDRGFRCVKEVTQCPDDYRDEGIWFLKAAHPDDPTKEACFVAEHEELMAKLRPRSPTSTPHVQRGISYSTRWRVYAPPQVKETYAGKFTCDFFGCRWLPGRERRFKANLTEFFWTCDTYGMGWSDTGVARNRDVALMKDVDGDGKWYCYYLDSQEIAGKEVGLFKLSQHERTAEQWLSPQIVALPPSGKWTDETVTDAQYWPAIGYKPHSAYNHLSCDPFPLRLRPGVLRGGLASGSLTTPLPANAWCSVLSGVVATTSDPRPVKIGTVSTGCDADIDPDVTYVGYQGNDGCATGATAQTLKEPCADQACLDGLSGGYRTFLSTDADGRLVLDSTPLPTKYEFRARNRWLAQKKYACAYTVEGGRSACNEGTRTLKGTITGIRNCHSDLVGTDRCFGNTYAYVTVKGVQNPGATYYPAARAVVRPPHGRRPSGLQRCRGGTCSLYEVGWEVEQPRLTVSDKPRITHVIATGADAEVEVANPTTVAASTANPAPAYATRRCTLGWPRRDADECVLERQRVTATSTTNEVGDNLRTGSSERTYTDTEKRRCTGIATFDSAGNKEAYPTDCLATLCDRATGVMPALRTTSSGESVLDCAAPSTRTVHPREARPVYTGLPVGQVASTTTP